MSRTLKSLIAAVLVAAAAGCGAAPAAQDSVAGVIAIWGAPGRIDGTFVKPRVIDVIPGGRLSVIDRSGRVQIFDMKGKFSNKFVIPNTQKGYPTGMTVTPDGDLWIAETHNYRVSVYRPDGTQVKAWGSVGTGDGQFVYASDVAVSPSGRVYVSDHGPVDRVQIFDTQGRFIKAFGGEGTGPGEFQRPLGLAIAPDGTLLVADAANHRVQRFTADGEFVAAYGEAGQALGQFRYPYDLAIAPDGTMYVLEYGNCRITRMTYKGEFLGTWGTAGSAAGQLAEPWTLALDAAGMLYIVDTGNSRIVELDPAAAKWTPGPKG